MFIIKPITIDPETEVTELSVPLDDVYPAWDSNLLYNRGAIITTPDKIWEARHSAVTPIDTSSSLPALYNQGIDPAQTNVIGRTNEGGLIPNATEYNHFGESWWRDATEDKYLANRYRMFDTNPAHYTETDVAIRFIVKPSSLWSGVAFFNIIADTITVTVVDGPEYTATKTIRHDEILSPEFQNEPQAAFVDLPVIDPDLYPNAALRVELSVSSPRFLRLGYFCIGEALEIGQAVYGVNTELMDFSRFERDVFGNVFTIQRGYSDKITYPYVIKAEDLVQVHQTLVARRATLTAYIGHPDVPLTITYGYFVDLDIPIDNWGQSEAGVIVESVLYDTPGSTEKLPNVVEFIDYDGTTACIEESLGRVFEVCLKNGKIEAPAYATILGVVVEPLDEVHWEIVWVVGESELPPSYFNITTDCNQRLPILQWPDAELPVEHLPAIALIKAQIQKYDAEVIYLEPATLIITDKCSGGGTGDCDGCYDTPVIDSHGWYDPDFVEPAPDVYAYSLTEVSESVEFEAAEIPSEGLEISGCAGEKKYYWGDITCGGGGYGVVSWSLSVSGDDAAFLASYIERSRDGTLTIPTEESALTITGAGRVLKSAWDGTVRVLMRVDFYEDTESALLNTGRTCGVPMNMGGDPFIGIPILPGEPETVIPLDPPEGEDPALYVIEVDLDEGDIFDQLDISVDGDATVYISVDSIPTVDDYDVVLTGTQTGSLSDLGIGTDATILILVVGADGAQTTLIVTPVVIPAQILTVASATHGQITTSPALEFVPPNVELVIASATHGQTADTITLTDVSTGVLEVQSATHGHTASSIMLIQHHVLEVQSATHGQTAGNLWLGEMTGNILRDSEGNILRDSEGNILRGSDA